MKKHRIILGVSAVIIVAVLVSTGCKKSQDNMNFSDTTSAQTETTVAGAETTSADAPTSEGEAPTETVADTSMPILSIDGIQVAIGETKLKVLLNAGFSVSFIKDGQTYQVNPNEPIAEPKNYYEVILNKDGRYCADMIYSNYSSSKALIGDCVIDSLTFFTADADYDAMQVLMDGVELKNIDISDVPDKFKGFEKSNTSYEQYRKTVMNGDTEWIATITANGDNKSKISSFGITNYQSK